MKNRRFKLFIPGGLVNSDKLSHAAFGNSGQQRLTFQKRYMTLGDDIDELLIPLATPCRRTQQRRRADEGGFTQTWDTVGAGAKIPRRESLT